MKAIRGSVHVVTKARAPLGAIQEPPLSIGMVFSPYSTLLLFYIILAV